MLHRYLLWMVVVAFAANENLKAQELEPLQADRPDQTECASLVPRGYIQAETGFLYEKGGRDARSLLYPSILWKYGVNDRFELRLITEAGMEEYGDQRISGFYPLTVGFKTRLLDEDGIVPQTAFIGHLTSCMTGKEAFRPEWLAPSFRLSMQHTLSDHLSLGYNLGTEWSGNSNEPTYIYTLASGISLTPQLGGFIEVYGYLPVEGDADHRFDCGLTYLVSNDLMVDLSGGVGITRNAPDSFIALGFSWRFDVRRE